MRITSTLFGVLKGHPIHQYKLDNNKLRVSILDYGGIITEFSVLRRNRRINLLVKVDSLDELRAQSADFNRLLGRCGGKIANAQVNINNELKLLPSNDFRNTINGGPRGFGRQMYQVFTDVSQGTLILKNKISEDDDGFPGDINFEITYHLTDDNQLMVNMSGLQKKCDGLFDPAIKVFFNNKTIENNPIKLNVDDAQVLALGRNQLPNGNLRPKKFNNNYCNNMEMLLVSPQKKVPTTTVMFPYQGWLEIYSDRNAVIFERKVENKQFALSFQSVPNSTNMTEFSSVLIKKKEQKDYILNFKYVDDSN